MSPPNLHGHALRPAEDFRDYAQAAGDPAHGHDHPHAPHMDGSDARP